MAKGGAHGKRSVTYEEKSYEEIMAHSVIKDSDILSAMAGLPECSDLSSSICLA